MNARGREGDALQVFDLGLRAIGWAPPENLLSVVPAKTRQDLYFKIGLAH